MKYLVVVGLLLPLFACTTSDEKGGSGGIDTVYVRQRYDHRVLIDSAIIMSINMEKVRMDTINKNILVHESAKKYLGRFQDVGFRFIEGYPYLQVSATRPEFIAYKHADAKSFDCVDLLENPSVTFSDTVMEYDAMQEGFGVIHYVCGAGPVKGMFAGIFELPAQYIDGKGFALGGSLFQPGEIYLFYNDSL